VDQTGLILSLLSPVLETRSTLLVFGQFIRGHCVLQLDWLLSPTSFLNTYYFISAFIAALVD
jgi:hypothetical protein